MSNNTCKFLGTDFDPRAHNYSRPIPYCGCATVQGRSYCAEHLHTVYQKGTSVHRRKDRRRAEAVWDLENEFNLAVSELEAEGEI